MNGQTICKAYGNKKWISEVLACIEKGGCFKVITDRGDRQTGTLSLSSNDETCIAKIWIHTSRKDRFRRVVGATKAWREWQTVGAMSKSGMQVPKPLLYVHTRVGRQHIEVYLQEYISGAEVASRSLHGFAKYGKNMQCESLSEKLIAYTVGMLSKKVVDVDHRVGNFLLASQGELYRVDFENAWVNLPSPLRSRLAPRMLAGLISSYAWAARPMPGLADHFTDRLFQAVDSRGRVRGEATKLAEREVKRLRERTGEDVPFESAA